MDLDSSKINFLSKNKKPAGKKRWYDNTIAKLLITSLKEVPLYKREDVALKITDVIESIISVNIDTRINTNKQMILGMYKEYEKRRWYDRNPVCSKAVKKILVLMEQDKEIQKNALTLIIQTLGEYYIGNNVKPDFIHDNGFIKHNSESKKAFNKENERDVPNQEIHKDDNKKESKLVISGEKLFVKKEKFKK
ncbi:MAG: hypothetical protein AB1782_04820 [Cyanobacteriota bacterium]